MKNAFSIDLEDWFCVHNLSGAIRAGDWERCELRVVENTERLLSLLSECNVKCTFFVLGWIAERCPDLIRRIAEIGHEIATHGYGHAMVSDMTDEQFDEDIARSLRVLRPLAGTPIVGYRAASFSVSADRSAVFRILAQHGIRYDSSVFPISFHPDYGRGRVPSLGPYKIADRITEFPMSCFEAFGLKLPCCGGGYFRLFPYAYTAAGIRRCNASGRPVVFYIHPWEIDPGQPRVRLPLTKRFRHYVNLGGTEARLRRLLMEFEFAPISSVLGIAVA